jgi:hypothetical protein
MTRAIQNLVVQMDNYAVQVAAQDRHLALRRIGNTACLALLALIAVGTGHLTLTTALAMPALVTQAQAVRGM